jgi:hypothetical protein
LGFTVNMANMRTYVLIVFNAVMTFAFFYWISIICWLAAVSWFAQFHWLAELL